MTSFRKHVPILLILVCSGILSPPLCSQEIDGFFPDTVDTTYLTDYKDLFTTRYYLLAQNTSFLVFPDPEATMVFQPNETGRFGLAGFYSWFGLGLSVGTKLFRKNPDIYGSTKYYDFRVNAYGKFLAVEGYFQYYNGFYMNYRSQNLKETFIIPGMELISMGIEGTYIYNYSRFSIRAAFTQNEVQKKSAGSLIVKPVFRYYNVTSDTGIVPGRILNQYSLNGENILSGNFYTLGIGPGYIYTLVFLKQCYLTAGVMFDMNWSSYHYFSPDNVHTTSGFSFPASVRMALGYNSDKWFIGTSFVSTVYYFQPNERIQQDFHYHLTQIRFWVGTRFDAFKRWNKKKS